MATAVRCCRIYKHCRNRRFEPMASTALTVIVLWLVTLFCHVAMAANWAQTTGPQQQNVVVSSIPGPDGTNRQHWSGREGMAVTLTNVSDDGRPVPGGDNRIFLMGGDDHKYTINSEGTDGGGGLRNDVWFTQAAAWKVTWTRGVMARHGTFRHRTRRRR